MSSQEIALYAAFSRSAEADKKHRQLLHGVAWRQFTDICCAGRIFGCRPDGRAVCGPFYSSVPSGAKTSDDLSFYFDSVLAENEQEVLMLFDAGGAEGNLPELLHGAFRDAEEALARVRAQGSCDMDEKSHCRLDVVQESADGVCIVATPGVNTRLARLFLAAAGIGPVKHSGNVCPLCDTPVEASQTVQCPLCHKSVCEDCVAKCDHCRKEACSACIENESDSFMSSGINLCSKCRDELPWCEECEMHCDEIVECSECGKLLCKVCVDPGKHECEDENV